MNTKSKQIHYVMFPVSRLTIVISNLVVIVVFFCWYCVSSLNTACHFIALCNPIVVYCYCWAKIFYISVICWVDHHFPPPLVIKVLALFVVSIVEHILATNSPRFLQSKDNRRMMLITANILWRKCAWLSELLSVLCVNQQQTSWCSSNSYAEIDTNQRVLLYT